MLIELPTRLLLKAAVTVARVVTAGLTRSPGFRVVTAGLTRCNGFRVVTAGL